MKNPAIYLLLTVAAAWLSGCASTGKKPDYAVAMPGVVITNSVNPELLQPPTEKFVLGPGDQLEIQVIGVPASRANATVGLDGKIYYSMLPGVDVLGLTLDQARERLEEEMGKVVNRSQVAVSLKGVGSKYVWLLGRINRPGVYPMAGPVTLIEGLSMAGGIAKSPSAYTTQDIGDLKHSFVLRDGKPLPVNFVRLLQEGDMSQNIYLRPDDFVFVPSSLSQEIYVLGAVVTPRTVPYADPMSLISAIAGANGPAKNAYMSHVAIVRGSLSQPQLIEVDCYAIAKGKAANVLLEPGDIVYVPLTPYAFITDYAELIVNTFVRTWAANMGVRAVLGSGTSVGVNVPVGAAPAGAAPAGLK